MITNREIRLFLEFYKEVFILNAPLSLLLLFFKFKLLSILIFFCTLGFAVVLGYFKIYKSHHYVYYHNCGLTKTKLLLVTSIVNIIVAVIIYFNVIWFII